jgi:hypothetical protein
MEVDAIEDVEVLEPLVDLDKLDHPRSSLFDPAGEIPKSLGGLCMNGIFYYLDCEKSRIFYGDANPDASKGTVLQRILPMAPCG